MGKRILCIIDALGPGGAERQMTGLVILLKECGHVVYVRYHEPKHFFTNQIKDNGIDIECIGDGENRLTKLALYYKEIRKIKPEVVISYLQSSNIIASLIRLSCLKFKLLVSERNTNTQKDIREYIRFNLYRIADWIIPNSYSQAKFIEDNFPFLEPRVKTIVNFVDTDFFTPIKKERGNEVLVVATIWPSKNTLGFIQALRIIKDKGVKCHVSWFGKVPDTIDYIEKCYSLIKALDVSDYIELKDKTNNIRDEYNQADYFCLPSFYEGTPNVICEAMASGLPIACSDVCDNSRYVAEGINGFLFNPHNPDDIAQQLIYMLEMDDSAYATFKKSSRNIATERFSKAKFINSYEKLIDQ